MVLKIKYDLSPDLQNLIVRIEAFKEFLIKMPLLPSWLDRLQLEAKVEEVYHTTQIEGNLLTLPETRRVVLENAHIPGKERSETEVRNASEANEFIQHLTDDNMTHELLHKLQHLLMKNVDQGKLTGRYRKCNVDIADRNTGKLIYKPPQYKEAQTLMDQLIGWVNQSKGSVHDLVRASVFHILFEKIHPYEDGNGRTGRMIESMILRQNGYLPYSIFSVTNYYDNNRLDYYKALKKIPKFDHDLTNWIEFVLGGLFSEMNRIWHRLANYHKQALMINLAYQNHANGRQLWLLNELFEKDQILISDYHKQYYKVSERTLRTDIEKLEQLSMIKRIKEGRRTQIKLNSKLLVFNSDTGSEYRK